MGGEALRYDRRDSTVFFDHRIARGSLAWQLERDRWHVGLGPRVERLWSNDAPDEEYSEWAGVLEWEWLGLGPFWEIAPAAGWRDYRETAASAPEGGPPIPTARSPYAFYELSAIADQPLPGSLRLRSQLQARWERNTDRSRDARSLYFSIDVRRLF